MSQLFDIFYITANDALTISSGGDTTLKGATAKADTIKADVGGNLAIESLQDTSTYASKAQNVEGSVTVGAGVSGSVSYGQTDVAKKGTGYFLKYDYV